MKDTCFEIIITVIISELEHLLKVSQHRFIFKLYMARLNFVCLNLLVFGFRVHLVQHYQLSSQDTSFVVEDVA